MESPIIPPDHDAGAQEKEIERTRYVRGQSGWITALYVFAFLRAAAALFAFIGSLLSTGGTIEFAGVQYKTFGALFSAIAYSVVGIAAYRRHLWGAYGLLTISLLELPVKLSHGVGQFLGSAGLAACFVKGTIDLFNSKNFPLTVELDKRFILKWSLLMLLIGALAGFFQTFNPAIVELVLGPPGSMGRGWALLIVAVLFTCGAQLIAVRRKASWPLEHILCASLVAWIVSGIVDGLDLYTRDEMSGGAVMAYVSAQGLSAFVTAFVAYGISRRLKPVAQGARA